MTEAEYIKATNRAKVSMALTIMRDVLPGEDYGVSEVEATGVKVRLKALEERLLGCVDIEGEAS